MEISPAEKLIITMLCDIQKHLKIHGEVDPDFVLSAVHGYEWALDWEYQGLSEKSDKKEVVRETADILTMWRVIESSYAKLSPADKKRIETEADPFGKDVSFEGFDGNHDPHFGIAQFLVEKMGRFAELKGRAMNSHSQSSLALYRRMMPKYEAAMKNKGVGISGSALSPDEIINILKT